MAIYMKYDGVDGDVTETGHPQWIELHAVAWGVGRGISTAVGSAAERESGAPSVSEVVVEKENDIATGKLMQEALGGHGKTVTIDFTRTDKNKQDIYLSLELSNTLISGYSHKSQAGRPIETIALNFTKISFKTKQMKDDGGEGQPFNVIYDLETAELS